jgi:hypothetical protein
VSLNPRQFALLQALVKTDENLREQGHPADFMLLQMPGPAFGLTPEIEGEADILDLHSEGHVHLLPSNSESVLVKFALTQAGRASGQPKVLGADIESRTPATAPPSGDEILAWLGTLATSGPGSATLNSGRALMNEARSRYGAEHVETVARRIVDLGAEGLLAFDDPSARIDQLSMSQRLSNGGDFRLTSHARDRLTPPVPARSVTQIIHATQAQVAAGT